MKFKHVLFSGLLMSTAFVACTNEEFQEVGNQASMKDAISLGEGFTISGSIMNAQTRAIYEDETSGTAVSVKSVWEPEDKIGAAWYAAYTGPSTGFLFDSDKFASNHPYERKNKEGNVVTAEFETLTNSFAGKYVLYFPYNEDVAATSDAIPVKSETAQTMDVANPLAHVNKNMFFYENKEYTVGGNQLADFELTPVPVLYRFTFEANEVTRGLIGKTISKIVVETIDDKFYSDGELSVDGTGYGAATSIYAGVTATNVYTLDVTGNETDTDYQITDIGKDGATKKPFYISILPAHSDIAKLTFKVITTDGLVFERELVLNALDNKVKANIIKEGGLFSNNIKLDKKGTADGSIYTTQQFENTWKEALDATTAKTITLGAPMNVETLEMNKEGADITIAGSKLVVEELNIVDGALNVANLEAKNVTIKQFGQFTTTGSTTITGDLTIDSKDVTLAKVEKLNNVNVNRQAALSVTGAASTKTIEGTFTSGTDSEVTLKDITLKGVATLNGVVSTSGTTFENETVLNDKAELTAAGTTTFNSVVTNDGTIANTDSDETIVFKNNLTNNGTITIAGTNVSFEGTTTNEGTVTVSAAATNKGAFTNNGVLTIGADLTNAAAGTLTLSVNPTGNSDIVNEGTVNVTAKDIAARAATPAELNIVNSKTLNISLSAKADEVTFKKLTNSGEVIIAKGTVKESADDGITQTAGDIMVKADGILTFNGTNSNALVAGYIIIEADGAVTGTHNNDKIACSIKNIATAGTDATYVIIDETTSLTSEQIDVVKAKNLILRADLKLEGDMQMAADKNITVEDEVTLTGKGEMRTLSFTSGSTMEVKGGTLLKLGTNATLNTASGVTSKNYNTGSYGAIVKTGGTLTES